MTCKFCGLELVAGDYESIPACTDCIATGRNKQPKLTAKEKREALKAMRQKELQDYLTKSAKEML